MVAISQPAHARLAGAIAKHWGNQHTWRSEPWAPVVVAANRHDDGWEMWDASPTIDPSGAPLDFITVSTPTRVEIYRQGVEMVRDEDPHARALVSMHLAGLFLGRFEEGAPRLADYLEGSDKSLVGKFVADQYTAEDPPEGATADVLMDHYRLLQVFDQISLLLCLTPPGRASNTALRFVPLQQGGTLEQIVISVDGVSATLDPYPLGAKEVAVSVGGRLLDEQTFDDSESYRRALAVAPKEELHFILRPV